ncbi:tyrosine-type recombinase/integrase [Flavobacterium sp. DGU11]|uniref:Tyrosine-type recombinase/integrase n=1 Tax=Flavobacterium arundinis TaxID=3139143 RepID=A0ABU9I135_9FLAO
MSAVNFLYRSTKSVAFVNVRLLFTHEGKNHVYQGTSKIEVSKQYWDKLHNKRTKDPEIVELQRSNNDKMYDLERHILKEFNSVSPSIVNKEWLKAVIDNFYNPRHETDALPKDLVSYISTYIDYRKSNVTESTKRKIRVVQEVVKRFQDYRKKTVYIKDFSLLIVKEFQDYCYLEDYSQNTTARAIRYIKTICRHAKTLGLETHAQLDAISISYKKSDPIYLTPEEISRIEELTNLSDYLENVRDWFLISYNTAQRISDFLRFKSDMIKMHTVAKGELRPFLEFTQEKTGNEMTIPLTAKVMTILNKRNGEFPRKISDQKYNIYLKELCEKANITDLVFGTKKVETSKGSKKYRNKEGFYPKFELVSSHVGRYSFATNNYAKNIPTAVLRKMTGHSSEAMFLNYIGKSGKDSAIDMSIHFH